MEIGNAVYYLTVADGDRGGRGNGAGPDFLLGWGQRRVFI